MLLITDVDGVLLDWHKGFISYMKDRGCYINPESLCDTWDMTSWFLDLQGKPLSEWIKEFNTSGGVLQPIYDAFECLRDIQWETGCDIIALSSFGVGDNCNKKREDNLRKLSLSVTGEDVFTDFVGLPLGCCKEDSLVDLISKYSSVPVFFVEDNASHAAKAVNLGVTTFLLDTAYNKENTNAIRVESWDDIFHHIIVKSA